MYLSRIRLNEKKRDTQAALDSPSKFHGAVERCFDAREDRKLWRIDTLHDAYYLLILSPGKPELTEIKRQFGFPGEGDQIKSYDAFLDSIRQGSIWQFRLAANPVNSVPQGNGKRGKVVAHVSEKYQMEWLRKKAEKNGFTVISDGPCVIRSGWKIFQKKDGMTVRIKEVIYQGILRVDDIERFKQALISGIGREKAYGMGLLTIMRAGGITSGD